MPDNSKVSGLTATRELNESDLFYVVHNGNSNAISKSDLANQLMGGVADYYGMIIHQNVSNPSQSKVDYIGINANFTPMSFDFTNGTHNMGSWGSMPTIVKNVPAMIRTNGTLDYYLDPSDYSKKIDGSTASDVSNLSYDGNAFAWFEPIWMSIKALGDDIEVRFAYSKLDDDYFEVCPTGCGVWLPMFYGYADGSSAATAKMRSIAGTNECGAQTGNTDTASQKTSISNNGSNYFFFGGKLAQCISLLSVMWFKSTNSDVAGTGNRNGYNASAADGRYGTLSNPIVSGGQFVGTNNSTSANKFLHCLPLATYDVFARDPYTLCVNGEYKVSKDYTYDVSGATLETTGVLAPDEGYIKTMAVIPEFGLLPKETGGSSSTYYCDSFWINKTITAVALRFGYCGNGAEAGGWFLGCNRTASHSNWHYGCALCLKQSV